MDSSYRKSLRGTVAMALFFLFSAYVITSFKFLRNMQKTPSAPTKHGSGNYDSVVNFWHDVDYTPSSEAKNVVNMITEIQMHTTAKMEVNKNLAGNPIRQDTHKDGSPRHYTYGVPFFNYGLVPQTWEDPDLKSAQGYGGDNDPIDIMELGSQPLPMKSITPCRILGSLELIDQGEVDHKLLCISLNDPEAPNIFNMNDLEKVKPGTLDKILDWLKNYKTTDGKPPNTLASDLPRTVEQAMALLEKVHQSWRKLCGHDGTPRSSAQTATFWLDSPGCRGGSSN